MQGSSLTAEAQAQEMARPIQPWQVTIVIPTLDESEAIGKVIDEVSSYGFQNILVVDGYSKDGTADIAKRKGAVVIFQESKGKAGAIRTAINHVETPYMLVMDGDFTYDPASIENLLRSGQHNDEVIGIRKNRENIPALNRFGNWVLNISFKWLIGTPVSDVCSGMYLLRTEFAKGLIIGSESFDCEVEIASQVATGGRLAEAPINYRKRIGQRKLNSLRDGIRIMGSIIWMANHHNPVFLYSGISFLIMVPASIILVWVAYENFVNHIWHAGFALFGGMLVIVATQALAIMVISLLIKRVERRIIGAGKRSIELRGSKNLMQSLISVSALSPN